MATICGWFTPRMCKFHYKLYKYQVWSWFHQINANTIVGRRRKIEIGNSLDATQYCNPVWKFLIGLASCHQIPETALSSAATWATHILIFHCYNLKQKGSWKSQERASKTMWMGWDTNYRYWHRVLSNSFLFSGVCSFLQECKTTLYSFYQHHKTLDMNDLMVVEKKHFVE